MLFGSIFLFEDFLVRYIKILLLISVDKLIFVINFVGEY